MLANRVTNYLNEAKIEAKNRELIDEQKMHRNPHWHMIHKGARLALFFS